MIYALQHPYLVKTCILYFTLLVHILNIMKTFIKLSL